MTPVRITVALCLAFVAIVLGMFVVSVLREPQLSDDALRERGVFLLPTPRELPPFALVDHMGEPFTPESLVGRWTFAFFGFTHCPDVCPTSMSVLGQVDRALVKERPDLAEGFQAILVTVDPERDSPEDLGGYATAFSERFLGVRGETRAIAEFAKGVNVAFAKVPTGDGKYSVDHTGNIVIFNPRGHYHGFIKLPHKAETIRLAYQSLAARF